MPKVTLQAPAHAVHTVILGKGTFRFKGGKTLEVPPAVAMHCRKKKKSNGDNLFTITAMPKIVKQVPVDMLQNVGGRKIRQEIFDYAS